MKVLTRLLLTHWFYFTHEIMEFGALNFLTGKNASGKSTIIDAMQLILLGDTSGHFFNKAASGRSDRTLKGYLLGELGDNEGGGFRYLRTGRFTSYIAMEFYDQERAKYFTAGCCFDVYSESDIPRLFFLYDGVLHPEGFLSKGTPLDIPALRVFLKEQYSGHYETTDVGRVFRTKLYGRLGGLRDRFAELLRKAVSFDPKVDIDQFIADFLQDSQQTIDILPMKENIRSYKRLEYEASILQERMALLDRIVKTYENYDHAKNNETLYSFLIARAAADMKATALQETEAETNQLIEQYAALGTQITDLSDQLVSIRGQRDTLNAELLSNGEAQALAQIDRQMAEHRQEILALRDTYEKAAGLLTAKIAAWRNGTEAMLQKIKATPYDLLQASMALRIGDLQEEGGHFLAGMAPLTKTDAESITQMGAEGLKALSCLADTLRTHAIELNARLRDEQDALAKQRAELLQEQQSLEAGIYRFPQDALDLKAAVCSRLRTIAKKDVTVHLVAEAAEIKNDRWRNAIEGYLHTQKFYLIVPPAYFGDAIRVFDAIKRTKQIYGTGIVDIEKLRRANPTAEAGSLAEELITDNEDVRIFIDFVLGKVQKCDQVQALRRFRTAITDEGMLYHNYVVRAMDPARWAKPAIGQGAIQRRLDVVKAALKTLTEQVAACAQAKTALACTGTLVALHDTDIEHMMDCLKNLAAIPRLESELASLQKNRDAVDVTAIEMLKARIVALDNDIATTDNRLKKYNGDQGRLEERIQRLQNGVIPVLKKEAADMESAILVQYEAAWIQTVGSPRYSKELSTRGKAEHIALAFPREQSRARNAKEDAWESLVDLRRSYNERYKMGFDIKAPENELYGNTWLELSDNQLPEYQAKIDDAKSKTLAQFQDDFLDRLRHNIETAIQQIDELNGALKHASFGGDTYRFRIVPKQTHKRYYDMIMDKMKLNGEYNIFSTQFNEKYKAEISDLFSILIGGDGGDNAENERRVKEYTDFRTYLSFDLEVLGADGESQRLSRTMGKKSGGETQTPFYVAMLASFAQLYRTGRDTAYKTLRLIIFDEAFSKMDGERIIRSIELLRQFEFQAILAAPPDKIDDIAMLVDKNLCVIREGNRSCVGSFDPKKAEVNHDT